MISGVQSQIKVQGKHCLMKKEEEREGEVEEGEEEEGKKAKTLFL